MNRILEFFSRWRTSKGFGVQSPAAYQFISYVLCEKDKYYAYSDISALSKAHRLDAEYCRLLFRLANFWQPETVVLSQGNACYKEVISLGCCKSSFVRGLDGIFSEGLASHRIVILDQIENIDSALSQFSYNDLLIVQGIAKDSEMRELWSLIVNSKMVSRTYDLRSFGIAFFEKGKSKEHYKLML